ncbi:hypothetical protein [Winogradskyella sp. PC D3.3]
MLYIKFKIQDASKYEDFQKLYEHMVKLRQPNFELKDENPPEFDWDNMNEQETADAIETILDYCEQDKLDFKRYQNLIPHYARLYFGSYIKQDHDNTIPLSESDAIALLKYLEYGFEVELNKLEKLNEDFYILEFSTGNFPFGGLERFIMTLRAYNLIAVEYFDGFKVSKLDWLSPYEYHNMILPEQTKAYLKTTNH